MSLWGAIGGLAGTFLGGPLGGAIGGALGGALDSSGGNSSARQSTQAATDAAIAEQRRQYDLTRSDSQPWRDAGKAALGQLQTDINTPTTAADVMQDPGYQYGLEQGQRAINQRIAAGGGRVSGQAIKAAGRFGTDYASTGYGAAYQRRQDRLNRLQALAGLGQTATSGTATAGMNTGNQISNLISSQGNATGASQVANGSIWSNTGNQLAALIGRNINNGGVGGGGGLGGFSISDLINGTGLGGGL